MKPTRLLPLAIALIAILARLLVSAADGAPAPDVRKIWDAGGHNAFTDLIRWHDQWWCTFRESDAHAGGDGKIRVLNSADGSKWESAALLSERDIDLRDPKFSITPDDRLMIVAGGSVYLGTKQLKGRQPRVTFSPDGRDWTTPQKVLEPGEWLWRVTWHNGIAYGTSYSADDATKPGKDSVLRLFRSTDGLDWKLVCPFDIAGRPNEATLRVLKNGQMMAMVRREAGNRLGWIGSADAPYDHWTWHESNYQFGGPNFIELPDGSLVAGTRDYSQKGKSTTLIARVTADRLTPLVTLPSGGDNSYPGLVWHDGVLWVSYYSSHEGKTSIYLAKIPLPTTPSHSVDTPKPPG